MLHAQNKITFYCIFKGYQFSFELLDLTVEICRFTFKLLLVRGVDPVISRLGATCRGEGRVKLINVATIHV